MGAIEQSLPLSVCSEESIQRYFKDTRACFVDKVVEKIV